MFKRLTLVCGFSLLACSLYAQTVQAVLQQIEQHNPALQALKAYHDSQVQQIRSGNNLPDPQLEGYYLSWGEHQGSDYTEFELSQSLEFPTVYAKRGRLISQQKELLQLTYAEKRQEVLLEATQLVHQLIYLNKQLALAEARLEQAKAVYDQMQALFEAEQIGILDLNKGKVAWLQVQFMADKLQQQIHSQQALLEQMNNGNTLILPQAEYARSLPLPVFDSLWQEKLYQDPRLQKLRLQELVAEKQLSVARHNRLPDLRAGINSQGINGDRYTGIYGGLSIPLWSHQHTLKAARAELQYEQLHTQAVLTREKVDYQTFYRNYQLQLEKLEAYQQTLAGLQSEDLLLQAYELGEISYLDYYREVQFYREAYDTMLEMELQLHQLNASLLQHTL